MPTVKLKNGNVVTKIVNNEQRISCSCCEPECCTYPASLLNDTYTSDDLPDALTVNWAGHLVGNIVKSGSSYASASVTLSVIGGLWTLTDTSPLTAAVRTVGNCLIQGDGGLTPDGDLIEDQFSACYEATWSNDQYDNGPGSALIIRNNLCYWESIDSVSYLLLGPYTPFGAVGIWEFGNDIRGAVTKSGESPEGTWDDVGAYVDLQITAVSCP